MQTLTPLHVVPAIKRPCHLLSLISRFLRNPSPKLISSRTHWSSREAPTSNCPVPRPPRAYRPRHQAHLDISRSLVRSLAPPFLCIGCVRPCPRPHRHKAQLQPLLPFTTGHNRGRRSRSRARLFLLHTVMISPLSKSRHSLAGDDHLHASPEKLAGTLT
jgi:hypothetical protein